MAELTEDAASQSRPTADKDDDARHDEAKDDARDSDAGDGDDKTGPDSDEAADAKATAAKDPGVTQKSSASSAASVAAKPRFWSLIAVGLGIGLAVGGVGGFFTAKQNLLGLDSAPRETRTKANAYVPADSWTVQKGSDRAKVTIVEFTDFQCPFCANIHGPLKEALAAHEGTVAVHVRNFPLTMHKRAEPAARAFQAAHRQGKSIEMADLLFANMKALSDDDLAKYAEEVGLDMAKFKADYNDPAVAKEVARDLETGKAAGVSGTPAVFVNGRRYGGPRTTAGFNEAIEAEVKRADALLKKGTPEEKIHETLAKQAVAENPKP